jgi:hypothetical protein
MNTTQLLWGILFGSIGLGYFVYGKKQRAVVPLACGIGLMGFSYFVDSTGWMLAIGGALSVLPYFFRL